MSNKTQISSNKVNYVNLAIPPSGPIKVSISSTDYPRQLIPSILTTNIELTSFIAPYDVNVKIGNIASYTLNIDSNNNGTFSKQVNCNPTFPKGNTGSYSLDGFPIPNATINLVTLNTQIPKNLLYDNEDQYLITMISSLDITVPVASAQINFIRKNNVAIEDYVCDDKSCFCTTSCKTTRIPIINILGQSMFDGSDVSDMTFTIFDEFTYEEKKCIVEKNKNKCQLLRLECNKLQKTTFVKCCPWMVSVVKGKGSTLREKLEYIIKKNQQPNNIGINDFLEKMIKYGMTRYILCRILYGHFNIDYLLEKYYLKFIKDLGKSRFCRFVEFFQDCTDVNNNFVGYEKYFLYEIKC